MDRFNFSSGAAVRPFAFRRRPEGRASEKLEPETCKSAIERRLIIQFNSASCSHDNNYTLSAATKHAGKDPRHTFGRKYIHHPHPKSFPLASGGYLVLCASIADIQLLRQVHLISMCYL